MKKLTLSTKIAYALGQFGWSMLSGIVTTYLLFYYIPNGNNIPIYLPQQPLFGILSVFTCIFIFTRVFGTFTDAWLAARSDRSTSKYGKRISYMAKSAIPFAFFTICVFMNPHQGPSWLNALLFCINLFLFYFFLGMYVTPYNALFTEITETEKERIDIATLTSITWFLGYFIITLAPNMWMYIEHLGFEKSIAIQITIAIFALIALIFLLMPIIFIQEKKYTKATAVSTDSLWKSLKIAFKNQNFRRYMWADLSYWIALYFFQMTILQYITVLLKLPETNLVLFTTLLGIGSFACYIPVNMLTKKFGKRKMLLVGYLLFCLVYGLSTFLGLYAFPPLLQGIAIILLAAIPIAIFGILPNAAIADIVEADTYESGVNRGGIYFGTRTLIMKIGNVLAVGMLTFGGQGSSEQMLRITTIGAILFTSFGFFILKFGYDEEKIQTFLKQQRTILVTK